MVDCLRARNAAGIISSEWPISMDAAKFYWTLILHFFLKRKKYETKQNEETYFFPKNLTIQQKNEKEIQIRPFVDDKNFKSEKFSQICLFCLSFFSGLSPPCFFCSGVTKWFLSYASFYVIGLFMFMSTITALFRRFPWDQVNFPC